MSAPSTPTITIMVVGPTTRCDVQVVKRDYRVFNQLVNGSISMLRLPDTLRERGYHAYCDDNAVAAGQTPNRFAAHLGHWRLLGPVVFFKDNGAGDEVSLSPNDVRYLARFLAGPPPLASAVQADLDRQFWAEHPSGMAFRSYDTIEELLEDAGL